MYITSVRRPRAVVRSASDAEWLLTTFCDHVSDKQRHVASLSHLITGFSVIEGHLNGAAHAESNFDPTSEKRTPFRGTVRSESRVQTSSLPATGSQIPKYAAGEDQTFHSEERTRFSKLGT